MESGIYAIINKLNNKIYVGSTINFKKRWNKHKTELRHRKHHSKHLENAWHLHGEENFEFKILEEVTDLKNLVVKEQKYINLYNSFDENNGYNICKFAETVKGVKRSEEEKITLSKHFNPKASMSLEIANEIRKKYLTGLYSQRQLSKEFKTSKTTIKEIIYNTRWRDENYSPPTKDSNMKRGGKKLLTKKQTIKIKELRANTDLTIEQIAKKFKVKIGVINRIIYSDLYKRIG